ncbi:MAG: alpha/beta hydrolase [Methanocorpusculum sp.]|nr:alpha/beta hydrolase [Methanocorpusculum sp.]
MKFLKPLICLCIAVIFLISAGCVTLDVSHQQNETVSTIDFDELYTFIETELNNKLVNTTISYADVNGAKLAYREFGDKNNEPLILIMGYTGEMDKWSGEFVYSLAEDYHVYIYDHRGMGYSTDNGEQYEFIQLADDCVKLMNSLGYEKFNVLGHSMGSVLTQLLIVEYPENISKAVIVSTIPNIYYEGAEGIKNTIMTAAADKNTPNGIYRESIAMINYQGVFDELKNVDKDVMVLVGTADTITPQQGSVDVAGEIDGAWLIRFKDCSHRIWSEIPIRSSECIKLFLNMDETYSP